MGYWLLATGRAASISLLLALAGCSASLSPSDTDFGAHYQVAADPAPTIIGTALVVTLQYSGCNGGHDFLLVTSTKNLTAQVWLKKRTADQSCDMLITEERSFDLPVEVTAALHVTLLSPNGNFTIR